MDTNSCVMYGKLKENLNKMNWSRNLKSCADKQKDYSKYDITKFLKKNTSLLSKDSADSGMYRILVLFIGYYIISLKRNNASYLFDETYQNAQTHFKVTNDVIYVIQVMINFFFPYITFRKIF